MYLVPPLCQQPDCVRPSHMEVVTRQEAAGRAKLMKSTPEEAQTIGAGPRRQRHLAEQFSVAWGRLRGPVCIALPVRVRDALSRFGLAVLVARDGAIEVVEVPRLFDGPSGRRHAWKLSAVAHAARLMTDATVAGCRVDASSSVGAAASSLRMAGR